jgi:hypothetical protein
LGNALLFSRFEKLPAKPWEEIVEMNSFQDSPLIRDKWYTDLKVKLVGNYSKEDSVTISTILNKLDALTETISITFSKSEKPNFIIDFSDKHKGLNSCLLAKLIRVIVVLNSTSTRPTKRI